MEPKKIQILPGVGINDYLYSENIYSAFESLTKDGIMQNIRSPFVFYLLKLNFIQKLVKISFHIQLNPLLELSGDLDKITVALPVFLDGFF